MQMNRVEVAGYLVRKPEIRYLPSGMPVANARLGQTYRFQDNSQQWHERTNWHSLSFYGDLSKLAATFEKGEMKTFFAGVGRDAGGCKVERATGGDGAQQAKWRLACEKAPIDLELTIDGHNGRVGRMLLTPASVPEGITRCEK